MGACLLVSAAGHVDILPAHTQPDDVFDQGPLHISRLESGWQLRWSSASYHLNEVNQFASSLVKQLVKGDAFFTHPTCSPVDLNGLLQSRQLHLMQPSLPKNTIVRVYGQALTPEQSPGSMACSSSDRIQAAQSIRSRILNGINMSSSVQGLRQGGVLSEGDQLDFKSSMSSCRGRSKDSLFPKSLSTCSSTTSSSMCEARLSSWPLPGQLERDLAGLYSACDKGGSRGSVVSSCRSSTVDYLDSTTTIPPTPSVGDWDDLPGEVVSKVASYLGNSIGSLKPLYGTCRSWHSAILSDDQLLKGLQCSIDPRQPFPGSCIHIKAQLKQTRRFPKLLERARAVGNLTAMACMAKLLDAGGRSEEALVLWRKCGKAGVLEGQLRLGLALYRGTCGAVQDAEEAHLYLNRAVKQVFAGKSVDELTGEEALLAKEVFRSGCLILGYLHFDGEGTKNDRQEATRFFKISASHGCKEAEQVLGWIFNTGQYG